MKVSILGKQRKGKKSFELESADEFGFNIECFDGGGAVKMNNIMFIDWMNEGEHVFLEPAVIDQKNIQDFTRYNSVKITKAKKVEKEKFVSRLG